MSECASPTWGRDRHRLLTVEEAWASIAESVAPLECVEVPVSEAFGRVLATCVEAAEDCPPFDKAMMDGFAVRSADCATPGAKLGIVGLAAAGAETQIEIRSGQAMRINTGAPLPPGADAVVMIEKTNVVTDGKQVRIDTTVPPGKHVEPRGGIRSRGDTVLQPPVRLGPAEIAAAANAGAGRLSVYRHPGVAIVLTGDELVPAGEPKRPGQIHECNGPMLSALMRQFGGEPLAPVIVPDAPDKLKSHFQNALHEPVVVAVGGMSMGTLDLVPTTLESLGVAWKWHGVAMRPGKPVAYGIGPAGQHVFGLPGNPVSAFVCSWLFVRMVIDGLQGLPVASPAKWRATLARDVKASRDPRPSFVPARVWSDSERGLMVAPNAWKGSSDPFGLVGANALLIRETPTVDAPVGSEAEVIWIAPAMSDPGSR